MKKKENLTAWLKKAFPHRLYDRYAARKMYSKNNMNQVVRAAILRNINTIKSLLHEKEKDEETQEEA